MQNWCPHTTEAHSHLFQSGAHTLHMVVSALQKLQVSEAKEITHSEGRLAAIKEKENINIKYITGLK